jgi:hypothetical protein
MWRIRKKVRDGEDTIASTRDARATQSDPHIGIFLAASNSRAYNEST